MHEVYEVTVAIRLRQIGARKLSGEACHLTLIRLRSQHSLFLMLETSSSFSLLNLSLSIPCNLIEGSLLKNWECFSNSWWNVSCKFVKLRSKNGIADHYWWSFIRSHKLFLLFAETIFEVLKSVVLYDYLSMLTHLVSVLNCTFIQLNYPFHSNLVLGTGLDRPLKHFWHSECIQLCWELIWDIE